MTKQPQLCIDEPPFRGVCKPTQTMLPDDAVTRHDDWTRICPAGLSQCTWDGLESLGKFAVGMGLPARNLADCLPHPVLKQRTVGCCRDLEDVTRVLEILLQLKYRVF